MTQLLEIQEQLHAACINPNVKNSVKAACARAWSDLEERKRILRGLPLPDTLARLASDPADLAKRLTRRKLNAPRSEPSGSAFIEVTPAPEAPAAKESLNPEGP